MQMNGTIAVDAAKYRGACVEDLDLPPALSIGPSATVSDAYTLASEREYSQLTVTSAKNRRLVGYIDMRHIMPALEAGKDNEKVRDHMVRFKKREESELEYQVITPETPLEQLEAFLLQGHEFAIVTDSSRRFVLAIATKQDLEERFLKRRPSFPGVDLGRPNLSG
ncbi:hypothetical protein YB2330_003071 [Saitoella coloradoensis]